MKSNLIVAIVGASVVVLIVIYLLLFQDPSKGIQTDQSEPAIRNLPLERAEQKLWSPQTEALVESFYTQKSDLETLLRMMADQQLQDVSYLRRDLQIITDDGHRFEAQDIDDREQWSRLLEKSYVVGIMKVEDLGDVVFFLLPPRTTPDRYEAINYFFNYPAPAKQCSDQYRDIPCGVCDVLMDDRWSIRYSWSSGDFEREYSEDFAEYYGNAGSQLSLEEINAKLHRSRKECRERGLREMGYEDPGLY